MEGVKNLVVKKHNLPVTKIVEELMEVRNVFTSACFSIFLFRFIFDSFFEVHLLSEILLLFGIIITTFSLS